MEGLTIYNEFITTTYEEDLLKKIYQMPWNCDLKRRTQQYGYHYSYTTRSLSHAPDIPTFIQPIIDELLPKTNQVIINEYVNGQSISPHYDNKKLFDGAIASLSLGAPCKFILGDQVYNINARSAMTMELAARYDHMHSTKPLKRNQTRVSITLRHTAA
jgi:alkylated DNA repair dioxygenase AlkB